MTKATTMRVKLNDEVFEMIMEQRRAWLKMKLESDRIYQLIGFTVAHQLSENPTVDPTTLATVRSEMSKQSKLHVRMAKIDGKVEALTGLVMEQPDFQQALHRAYHEANYPVDALDD